MLSLKTWKAEGFLLLFILVNKGEKIDLSGYEIVGYGYEEQFQRIKIN